MDHIVIKHHKMGRRPQQCSSLSLSPVLAHTAHETSIKAVRIMQCQKRVERKLLLVLNCIKQLSQMSRCFSQLHLHLGDMRGNISTWELYLDSFNVTVICELRGPERNAVVGADRHGLRVLRPFHWPCVIVPGSLRCKGSLTENLGKLLERR